MWLVLCESYDADARWVAEGLRARRLVPLELVTAQDLAGATRWVHRLGAGEASVEIVLADGRTLDSRRVRGVLNRLFAPSAWHLTLLRPRDREYAAQEWAALYLSWLYALPGQVLNRATPNGLCGRWRHNSEWLRLAAQAGLTTLPLTLRWPPAPEPGGEWLTPLVPPDAPTRLVLVVDGQPVNVSLPPAVVEGCRRLAELAGLRLLGVELSVTQAGPWTFAGIQVCPPLKAGGAPLLDVLTCALAPGSDLTLLNEVCR
jgi:hypothetical protein